MLKNKDGSDFKLSGPNPLMADQTFWGKFILHNKVGNLIFEKDPKIRPKPISPIRKEEPKEIKEEIVEVVTKTQFIPNSTEIWCLPASFKEYKDGLTQDMHKKIRYGKKFKFPGVIRETKEVYIILWCNTKAVSEGSIIYPRNQETQWWRVQETKPENNGYLVYATITDYHPDFSD